MQCSRLHLLLIARTQLSTVFRLCNYWLGFNTEAQLSTPTIESDQKMLDFETTNQNEMVSRLAPAALSNVASPNVTSRYGFINTGTAVDILADHGFHAVHASQQHSRNPANSAYAAHLIRFENEALNKMFEGLDNGNTNPQLIILNSHNKRTSLGLGQGMFRYACSNNLVFASAGVFSRLRHNAATVTAYEDIVRDKVKSLPNVMDTIQRMVELTDLSTSDQEQFARDACSLRGWKPLRVLNSRANFGPTKNASYYDHRTIEQMLTVRRTSDAPNNLWNVFNRVQETFCNGTGCAPINIVSTSTKYPEGRGRKARAITAVTGNTKINADLFELANEFMAAA